MAGGVRASVAPPRLERPQYGLVHSLTALANADERWQGGLEWEPQSCGVAASVAPCDQDDNLKAIDAADNPGVSTFEPLTVWAGYRCSTFGGLGPEREQRARNLLAAHESRAIEAEFWRGTVATAEEWDNNYLANGDSYTDLAPSDTSPLVYGLAALEEALAGCVGRGVIHATVPTVTGWIAAQAVRREGPLLLTGLNTLVIAGAGYDGAGDDGVVDTTGHTAWAFGTGLVDLRLDEVVVLGDEHTIDRRRNTWEVRAERLAAVTFDPCCHVGINVDLCSTFCVP